MSEERQQNQEQLVFSFAGRSEAPLGEREGTEALMAKRETEDPAGNQRVMEEVCERENRREALKRVRANQGSPGIDGMTVDELPEYLEQHWPAIREQLLNGTYEPKPVKRVEIPKPDGGVRKLGIPWPEAKKHGSPCQMTRTPIRLRVRASAGPVCSAGGAAGFTEAMGPDVFRTQLRFSTGAVGQAGGGTGAAVYRRRLRLVC